jgi:hypothetical protein
VLVNDSIEHLLVASSERGELSRREGHADIIGVLVVAAPTQRAARRRPASL